MATLQQIENAINQVPVITEGLITNEMKSQIERKIEEINEVFTKNASTVTEVKEWGLRELAYEIDGDTKGYYVLVNVEATTEAVKEFERKSNIEEKIIRHIVVLA